jgi:hypothetical protein
MGDKSRLWAIGYRLMGEEPGMERQFAAALRIQSAMGDGLWDSDE